MPRFLAYLTRHGMGLVAFDLSHPWLLEGAGHEIMTWLNRNNREAHS